jgi:hypothetical protein
MSQTEPAVRASLGDILASLKDIAASQQIIAESLQRLADAKAPAKEKVGTGYVADRQDYSTQYVAQLARDGEIPATCLVPGTGGSKPWKFFRKEIDAWIARR